MSRCAAILAACGMTLATGAAEARGLPDWARPIAEHPPEIGDFGEHDSRVLLRETRLSLMPDGRLKVRRCTASQALNSAASEIGLGTFGFDETDEIVRSEAWHMAPGAKRAKRSRGGVLDLSTADVFLSDRMTRVLSVDDVETGSLVFYEFEARERREQLAHHELFYADVPVREARVVVEAPEGWTVRHAWLRQEGPAPRREGALWIWEMTDLPAAEREDALFLGGLARAPLLVVTFEPDTDDAPTAAFREWKDVAQWYETQADGSAAVTPAIERTVRDLGTSADDFYRHVVAAGRFVRDRVRYLANDIGKGGYQPRTADSILTNLFGDCKDKGTLLQAMLAVDGLKSYPLLINASQPFTVSADLPSLYAFDHLVLGVAVPDGVELDVPAVVEVPGLGRLLVVDATDEYASVGSLSGALAGKAALVVAREASTLVTLPADDPLAHRIERRFDVRIAPDGALTGTLSEQRYGDPASLHRSAYRGSAGDYREALSAGVAKLWPGAALTGLEIVAEDSQGRFAWSATVEVPAPADPANAELLPLFPRALDGLQTVPLRRRTVPVDYRHALTVRYEAVARGVPEANPIPEPRERTGSGWRAVSELTRAGETVEGRFEVNLARLHFPIGEFDELKSFWRAARRVASAPLRPVPGQP